MNFIHELLRPFNLLYSCMAAYRGRAFGTRFARLASRYLLLPLLNPAVKCFVFVIINLHHSTLTQKSGYTCLLSALDLSAKFSMQKLVPRMSSKRTLPKEPSTGEHGMVESKTHILVRKIGLASTRHERARSYKLLHVSRN